MGQNQTCPDKPAGGSIVSRGFDSNRSSKLNVPGESARCLQWESCQQGGPERAFFLDLDSFSCRLFSTNRMRIGQNLSSPNSSIGLPLLSPVVSLADAWLGVLLPRRLRPHLHVLL